MLPHQSVLPHGARRNHRRDDRLGTADSSCRTDALDPTRAKPAGTLRDYLALARFDHSTKHIFIVPGIVLAYLLRGGPPHFPIVQVILGLILAAIALLQRD